MLRMRGSIFFKLFGILIVTGFLLNFLVYFALRFFANQNPIKKDLFETFSQENLKSYVEQIGYPPNEAVMNRITDSTESEIRIESNGKVWQTSDDLPSLDEVERHQKQEREKHRNEKIEPFDMEPPPPGDRGDGPPPPRGDRGDGPPPEDMGGPPPNLDITPPSGPGLRGPPKRIPVFFDVFASFPPKPAFIINKNGVKYGFFLPDRRDFIGRYGKLIIPLLLVLTFLIASAFFAIRYVLLPLNSLMNGVQSVAGGNLDSRVPVKGGSEFELVGEAFNNMVARIKETVEAKERLLIDVSHELQSPLARMKLAIELMKEEKAKERLKVNLKDLETMVAEILESARLDSSIGSLALQRTDLKHLVTEFLYVYETMGLPVFLSSGTESVIAQVDPSRLIIVLRNLIENALKYADNDNKRVDIQLEDQGSSVLISVKDNGKGIDKEEVPRIFEPFYRIDKSRTRNTGGYGLGLSLCKRIVDAHHGTIGIDSDETGTRVWFKLPKTID